MRLRPFIHLSLTIACSTVSLFNLVSLNRFGASSAGAAPSSHLEVQNLAIFPFPTVIFLQASKREESVESQGVGEPTQGRVRSVHSYDFHLIRRARLNMVRSNIPNPPRDLGRQTFFQLTRHTAFASSFLVFHRKSLHILSILLIAHLPSCNTVSIYMGIAESTEFTRASRAAAFRSCHAILVTWRPPYQSMVADPP